ncbi:hypothetical protein ACIBCA_12735 [Kitasatospora sp. NPDC051170]|uniref:hypothetical protein n=1 Tax=Kitasatospora sp. NPDC051170 TaxID=3364056 RepID=UPI0037B235F9
MRLFLELTVPRLPAPEQRMRQLRQRVVRRRRRRAAATTVGSAAAAAVTAFVLATSSGTPALAPPPAALAPAAGNPTPWTEIQVPAVAGLEYRLPPGWHDSAGSAIGTAEPVAFATTEPLPTGESACPKPTDFKAPYCPLLNHLRPGGGLVVFQTLPESEQIPAADALKLTETAPSPACRGVGGTRELAGSIPTGQAGPETRFVLSVCLNGTAESTLAQARGIAASISLGHFPG